MDMIDSRDAEPQTLVCFPNALRKAAGNQSRVMAKGRTVRALLESLDREYPGLLFHICYETGELRSYVNIFLNRENIRYLNGLDTPLPHGATLHIFPSVAGGSPVTNNVCTN